MSRWVAFVRNCSSPSSWVYELLRLPSLPSGFGSRGELKSNGIETGFARSIPLCFKMASMYCFCLMEMAFADWVISMPMILEGSLRSVVSHSVLIFCFIFSIRASNIANSSRSSTHTIMIANLPCPLPLCLMYAHGSKHMRLKLCFHITHSNSMFQVWPDCFRLYRDFNSSHM